MKAPVLTAPLKRRSSLRLTISAKAGARYAPFIKRQITLAHRLLKSKLTEINIALVGDAKMSELHEEFLGVSGSTDVITFPLDDDSGEIVICVPVAQRQAKANNVPLKLELLLYAIHGLLHLCGYDDRTAAGFREMHRTEDSILRRLGFKAVFKSTPEKAR